MNTGYHHRVQRSTPILIGFTGAALLCVSAWLATPQPWGLGFAGRGNPVPVRWAHAGPAGLGAALLLIAWIMSAKCDVKAIWRRFTIWTMPLVACPPLLSKDVWAYLEQGWIVFRGYNPYEVALTSIGGPFGVFVDSYWQYTTTVYPPLALQIQGLVVALTHSHRWMALLGMRVPGVIAVVAIGLMLPRIARAVGMDEGRTLWLGLLNPLVLVHFIGGAHNDAWGIALAVTGLWIAVARPRAWVLGCVMVGLAMAIKQPLGLWLVPVALIGMKTEDIEPRQMWADNWAPALGRLAIGLGGVIIGFAVPTITSGWGIGWAAGSGSPQSAGSQSLAHTLSEVVHTVFPVSLPGAKSFVEPLILLAGMVVIARLGWSLALAEPVGFGAWGLIVFALAYPSLQPWYMLWGGVLLGAVMLGEHAIRWVIGAVAGFLVTSVSLDYAGWPIPVAQVLALGLCWLLATRIEATRI